MRIAHGECRLERDELTTKNRREEVPVRPDEAAVCGTIRRALARRPDGHFNDVSSDTHDPAVQTRLPGVRTTCVTGRAPLVLVPGGFTGAWMWADVVALLEREGIRAIAVELPTIGEDSAGTDFYTDAVKRGRPAKPASRP
jgi:hypothetical protein